MRIAYVGAATEAVARLKACVKDGAGLHAYDVDKADLRTVLAALREAQAKYDALIAKIAEGWRPSAPRRRRERRSDDHPEHDRRRSADGG